jgi:phosphopantothenoylcysteine decarboxylase/phosphopantothenate--cysteine ligase
LNARSKNKTILITAGPTREAMDPVRFLTNASSGAVGIEIANVCRKKGAKVILVLGPTHLEPPASVSTVHVTTALEMDLQVKKYLKRANVFVACAAVGDWRFKNIFREKIKKGRQTHMRISLVRNPDILAQAGKIKKRRKDLLLVGFALETKNKRLEAKRKLVQKNLDLIIANDPKSFSSNNIKSTWIDRHHEVKNQPLLTKKKFAQRLVKWIYEH